MAPRTDGLVHFPPDGRVIGLGMALVAVLLLTISPLALLNFGYNYDDTGGSILEKIHPGTLLAFAVLIFAAFLQRNPFTKLGEAIETYPGTAAFVALIGVMIVYCVQIAGLPFTGFFDTFLLPVVIFFLFKDKFDKSANRR